MLSKLSGEKLKDGDYSEPLTDAQVYELLKIEGMEVSDGTVKLFSGSIVYEWNMLCPGSSGAQKKQKLDYSVMRERAINTFRK